MNKIILVFPDSVRMAHFVLTNNISNAEANTRELTLTAFLSSQQIVLAGSKYKAKIVGTYHTNAGVGEQRLERLFGLR